MNRVATGVIVLAIAGLVFCNSVLADEPVVRALLFYAEDCPHCQRVLQEIVPQLQMEYGDRLAIKLLEISDPEVYSQLLALEAIYGVTPDIATIPEMFVGDTVLLGEEDIRARAGQVIAAYFEAGGTDFPDPTASPVATPTAQPESIVHLRFFYSRKCPECAVIREEVIGVLQSQYGARLAVMEHDVETSVENYRLIRALEEAYGVKKPSMPEVFIGKHALIGEAEIRERLPFLVSQYLESGGAPLPTPGEIETVTETPSRVEERFERLPEEGCRWCGSSESAGLPLIYLAYFYQPGCQECDRAELDLRFLKTRYPQLVVVSFDARAEAALLEWLGEATAVPEEKRLTAPAVFVGKDALVGQDVNAREIESLLARYVATGADPIWRDFDPNASTESIIRRFRSLGVLTVIGAGLLDGVNPCAFTTIVFFISYLAFIGRKGRDIILVGAAFTLGVFLTYLLVGLGALKFITSLAFLSILSRLVYLATALLCAAFAILSAYDFIQARRGRPEEMRLRLPKRVHQQIHHTIRTQSRLSGFVWGALGTGVVVSLLELACTGQVYLPTIIFVAGVAELRAYGVLYLVLYNLMFIAPLVIVFLLAFYGTTSRQLGSFLEQHVAPVKLLTAILFAALAVWLFSSLL